MTCFVTSLATGRAWKGWRGKGTLGQYRWVVPLKQAYGLVSDRFISDGFGIIMVLSLIGSKSQRFQIS